MRKKKGSDPPVPGLPLDNPVVAQATTAVRWGIRIIVPVLVLGVTALFLTPSQLLAAAGVGLFIFLFNLCFPWNDVFTDPDRSDKVLKKLLKDLGVRTVELVTTRFDELKNQLESSRHSVTERDQTIKSLERNMTKLEGRIESLSRESAPPQELERLKRELEEKRRETDNLQELVRAQENILKGMPPLQLKVAAASQRASELSRELEHRGQENSALKNEREALLAQIQALTEKIEARDFEELSREVSAQKVELLQLRTRLEQERLSLTSRITSLEKTSSELRFQLGTVTQRQTESESARRELQQQVKNLSSRIQSLSGQLENLRTEKVQLNAQLIDTKKREDTLIRQKAQLHHSINVLESVVARAMTIRMEPYHLVEQAREIVAAGPRALARQAKMVRRYLRQAQDAGLEGQARRVLPESTQTLIDRNIV